MVSNGHRPTLVVVGTGMAGAKVVEEVLARAPDRFNIRMFGAEPHGTYNRILLSSVLGGFSDPTKLWLNPLEWYEKHGIFVHRGVKAEHIDRDKRVVVGGGGKVVEPYDYLVLATGSRPFVPPMEGSNQAGVFVFRTIEDCEKIAGFTEECDQATVIGGGLLGLEAEARGLLSHGLEVTVVEVAPHLMVQQLDAGGAELLKRKMEDMGVRVLLNTGTTHLLGDGRVTGLRFKDGSTINTDMVLISCGIRPNVDEARFAGLQVERAIVVDDHLRTSDPAIFAIGECAQHSNLIYGLVDPAYEQARVLADVLTGMKAENAYRGSKLATTLKVMGVELTSMGDVHGAGPDCEVVSHLDPAQGTYKKIVVRNGALAGAILLGTSDPTGRLQRLFRSGEALHGTAADLLLESSPRDALLQDSGGTDLLALPEDTQICNCNGVSKGKILEAIRGGKTSIDAIGACTRAGTGCGTCQPLLGQFIHMCGGAQNKELNKVELVKAEKDPLDCLPDIDRLVEHNRWAEMTEADKYRFKWRGLFFRVPTPGNFMMRLRFQAGRTNARQLRTIADLSDQYGKGFADLTTRQQIQLRWFTLADLPDVWRRLDDVGLHSIQTGMDSVRGICGCPLAGITPHELLDATPVIEEFNRIILGNKEFTNLPRKFNVTITGCLENCCHAETQDIGLVPAFRELDGQQVNGFNVLVGGKQGSGGYRPAKPLDVFVTPGEAPRLCAEIAAAFRDHGAREKRPRSRLAFLIEDRGIGWFRAEIEKRLGKPFLNAGTDIRKKHHSDHLGLHPQKRSPLTDSPNLFCIGCLVPVGRITTAQMRGVADIAERYGNGDVRVTTGQNLIIANIPENLIGALTEEPIFKELPFDPSPIMRGLVACTGNDYCGMALIETKGYALQVARELEQRCEGKKIAPLTIHWSGCPAGCGLHQVSTIGLQGVRARVDKQVVDAAHVCVKGKTGPTPTLATDLMYDVPIEKLADALAPLVMHLPR